MTAAALATLLVEPRNLIRADWQLSYACVLGIALFAPAIYEIFMFKERDAVSGSDITPKGWLRRQANHLIILPFSVTLAVQPILLPILEARRNPARIPAASRPGHRPRTKPK